MDRVAQAFEGIAAVVLGVGLVVSVVLGVRARGRTPGPHPAYRVLRQSFGGAILLALELLVAADLLRTVAVEATLESVLVLAGIVAIRTVLSFSLETEIEGVVPWRRRAQEGGSADPRPPDP